MSHCMSKPIQQTRADFLREPHFAYIIKPEHVTYEINPSMSAANLSPTCRFITRGNSAKRWSYQPGTDDMVTPKLFKTGLATANWCRASAEQC